MIYTNFMYCPLNVQNEFLIDNSLTEALKLVDDAMYSNDIFTAYVYDYDNSIMIELIREVFEVVSIKSYMLDLFNFKDKAIKFYGKIS